MRAVIQRVLNASVVVDSETVSSISRGVCVLVGIGREDGAEDVEYITRKVLNMRIFQSEDGKKWDKSVKDMGLEVLCVSQFTLYGYLKGNTLDFHTSMSPGQAETMYEEFLKKMKSSYQAEKVKDGKFGAMMALNLTNDGPVTICLDSKQRT